MNKLQNISQFKEILSNYRTSNQTKEIVNDTYFVILVAISSAGRNTMIKELLKTTKYHFVVSDTTRKPRVNDGVLEQNGKEYWFITEKEFLKGLQNGEYVEAAIIHNQQVSGVSVREIKHARDKEQIAISDIDVQGAERLKSISKNTVAVFVLPPSYHEWRRRLKNRGVLSNEELLNRLQSAKEELEFALKKDYFHFLINNNLQNSIKGLEKIVHGNIDPNHEQEGREIAREILSELKKELQEHKLTK